MARLADKSCGLPHFQQNFESSPTAAAQTEHVDQALAVGQPQALQNSASLEMERLQFGQT